MVVNLFTPEISQWTIPTFELEEFNCVVRVNDLDFYYSKSFILSDIYLGDYVLV